MVEVTLASPNTIEESCSHFLGVSSSGLENPG